MICRNATFTVSVSAVMFPDANSLSSRAQKRHFCALFASGTPIFRRFEHKIGFFVLFCPLEPPFSGISSTKSRFLCFFCLRDPHFRAFRAQNSGFCAFLAFATAVFVRFVSVSAITCHQYKESRVCCPAILSSICLGEGLGKPRLCIREVKRLFC